MRSLLVITAMSGLCVLASTAAAQTSLSSSVFAAVPTTASVCAEVTDYERLLCLTDALKASAGENLRNGFELPYNQQTATLWSNFPPVMFRDRPGLRLSEFNAEQRALIEAILQEASGDRAGEGWDEIEQILNADDYLVARVSNNRAQFGSENYYFALIGTPTPQGPWQLYFGGHHLAFLNTYEQGELIGATPSFRATEPFYPFEQNGRTNEPMKEERLAFANLIASLSESQQTTARLSGQMGNILVGPQQDRNFPERPSGLRVGLLSAEQRQLVLAAIATYVEDIDSDNAARILTQYADELADTWLSFSGVGDMNTVGDYIRIDGPSVWIECSIQRAATLDGVHPHSVWRDKNLDYGGLSSL